MEKLSLVQLNHHLDHVHDTQPPISYTHNEQLTAKNRRIISVELGPPMWPPKLVLGSRYNQPSTIHVPLYTHLVQGGFDNYCACLTWVQRVQLRSA